MLDDQSRSAVRAVRAVRAEQSISPGESFPDADRVAPCSLLSPLTIALSRSGSMLTQAGCQPNIFRRKVNLLSDWELKGKVQWWCWLSGPGGWWLVPQAAHSQGELQSSPWNCGPHWVWRGCRGWGGYWGGHWGGQWEQYKRRVRLSLLSLTCPAPRPSSFNWPGQDPSLDHLTDLTPPYTLQCLTPAYTTIHHLPYLTLPHTIFKTTQTFLPPYTSLHPLTKPYTTSCHLSQPFWEKKQGHEVSLLLLYSLTS